MIDIQKILIRTFQKSDWKRVWKYANVLSKEKTYITLQGEHLSQAEEKRFINTALDEMAQKKSVYLIAINEHQECVGIAQLSKGKRINAHIGTIGISVASDYRNQGLGSTLLNQLLTQSKTTLKDVKIATLAVFKNNSRAIHVYQKLGFVEYGHLPNGIYKDGQYEDEMFMYKVL